MGSYFLDTSAIIKYYFPEQGHNWVVSLCNPVQGLDLYIAQIALVEVVAAICRKAREQNISDERRDALINTFRHDSLNVFIIWPITPTIFILPVTYAALYRLRAYDAVQLACVLGLCNEAAINGKSMPSFVCADNNLVSFAASEGLTVINPNNYQ